MFKYFSVRLFIMIVSFIVITSVCYIAFEFANLKIWSRGLTDLELLEIAFENYKVFAEQVFKHNDWGRYDVANSVWEKAMEEIPTTVKIINITFFTFVFIGISLGIITAYYQGTWIDKVITYVAVFFGSIPEYITIGLLVLLFGTTLGWLPTFYDPNPDDPWNLFLVVSMPVLALSMVPILKIMRLLRSELIEEMNSDYAYLVRCKGFRRFYTLWKHALRNSIAPVLTEIPYIFSMVISLSFVIEISYNIRGAAWLLYTSVIKQDEIPYILVNIPISVLICAYYILSVLVVAFLCNVAMALIDPSIVLKGKKSNINQSSWQ